MHIHTLTAPSGTLEWLTVRCNDPTSVRLFWGAVPKDRQNGFITGYIIKIEGTDTKRSISTTEGYTTFKEVCDLRPSTEYTFSVSAKTVAGSGPAISVSFITPQEGEASTHIILIIILIFKLCTCSLVVWCGRVLILLNRFRSDIVLSCYLH